MINQHSNTSTKSEEPNDNSMAYSKSSRNSIDNSNCQTRYRSPWKFSYRRY